MLQEPPRHPEVELRLARPDDAVAVAELLDSSFPGWGWSAATVQTRLLDAPDVPRTWLAISADSLVGTASEQVAVDDDLPIGIVHWVAVAETRRGLGIGKSLTARVVVGLHNIGLSRVRLDTQHDRLPAIAMYRSLGFSPLVRSPGEQETWNDILSELDARKG